jgi:hypothetical protein
MERPKTLNLHTITLLLRKVSENLYLHFTISNNYLVFQDSPSGSDHALQRCGGGTIAQISNSYWKALKLECSGRLRNGQ